MAKEKEIRDRESKTDIAYRLMQKRKKEIDFYELWDKVKDELAKVSTPEEMEKVEDAISIFYTNLTLDGRFVQLSDNNWNLRERVKFDKVHIDMSDFYQDDSEKTGEEDQDNEDSDEEKEYIKESSDESYDDELERESMDIFRQGGNDFGNTDDEDE